MAIKALYHLEDLADSSGNGWNLAKTGTVDFIAAKMNKGASATWSNSNCLNYGNSFWNVGTSNFTLGCWFKKNGAPTNDVLPTIFNIQNEAGTSRVRLGIEKNTGKFIVEVYGSTTSVKAYSSASVCDNVWHLLVGTRISSTIYNYVDLTLNNSAGSAGLNTSVDRLKIGQIGDASYDNLGAAVIDEIVIADTAWSISEQKAFYYKVRGGVAIGSPMIF